MSEATNYGALTEAVYYILLSLYQPLHGYGMMQHIKELSHGRVTLGAGTLYGAINSLLAKGWIHPVDTNESSRKKQYQITDAGKQAISQELLRLKELIANGQAITGE
ncbi:PadR family transcriptional regulator [Bacillus rubiinfantis]|uniref:PadR family transcriptional regulator n=1 Tax=Bacillus rubiinfantis TaxID=1499680 RepID=UPI0005A9CE85|nr:PadR family transcriptional regulator [Bacillus rubiinfantis]